jgi:ABC-2 type transport system permease protein
MAINMAALGAEMDARLDSGVDTFALNIPSDFQRDVLAGRRPPTTHFVALAKGILYRGAGLDIVWPQFLALIAIGATFFSVANARFRSTIATMA